MRFMLLICSVFLLASCDVKRQPMYVVGDCFKDSVGKDIEVVYQIRKVDKARERYEIDWYWRNRNRDDKFRNLPSLERFMFDKERVRAKCLDAKEISQNW